MTLTINGASDVANRPPVAQVRHSVPSLAGHGFLPSLPDAVFVRRGVDVLGLSPGGRARTAGAGEAARSSKRTRISGPGLCRFGEQLYSRSSAHGTSGRATGLPLPDRRI